MADGTFKAIGQIQVGDHVVGWERRKTTGSYRDKYTVAAVVATQRRRARLVEVTLASGRVLRCTPDHLWSNGGYGRQGVTEHKPRKRVSGVYHYQYAWTQARVGATLRVAVDVVSREDLSPEHQALASWLGGIFDGEGSVSQSTLQLAQSQAHNPEVHAAIGQALTALGFHYSVTDRVYRLLGGQSMLVRFLVLCRPVRGFKIVNVLHRMVRCADDRVVALRDLGEGEVVSLQTSTGNYVAWGVLSKNCHVIGWDKRDVVMVPNFAQSIILDLCADSERRGHAVMLMLLKARQLGMTTLVELILLWLFLFFPRTYAVIASADPFKTVEMAGMIAYTWEHLPWWLVPQNVRFLKGVPAEIPALNSVLKPQWGNQYHGVGRGQTPSAAHLSELSSWKDAADDVDSALLKAMHPTPTMFLALESTALGRANWWFDKWESLKVEYPAGRSLIRPAFLPWFAGVDLYPTESEHRALPPPADWVPLDRTLRHAERARQAVLANALWLHYIGRDDPNWQMPRRQMWYYERERELAIKEKRLNKFLSEMPADDQEAFQNTNISVVDQDIVLSYRESALARPPLGVYTIVGASIHKMLTVPRSQWDLTKPTITIKPSTICRATETYQFVPLKFDGYIGYDPMWKLFIWEWPEPLQLYAIGVDTSDGIGQDWSVLGAIRKGTTFRPHGQVAEFASPYIKAGQLWDMTLALGAFYSTLHPRAGRRIQSRICVECRGNGEKVQDELKKRGWTNFHPWKKLDNKKRLTNDKVHKEGVFTNVWYRSMMMDTFLTAVDEETLDIRSPWLVNEMETLERDPEEKSARAAYNTHDDRVMAIGFPLESLTVDDRQRTHYAKQTPQYLPAALDESDDAALIPFATYQPPLQARSDILGRSSIPLERRVPAAAGYGGLALRLGRYTNRSLRLPGGHR